jgi:hypothetical protein
VIRDASLAIIRAEKNRVAQRFYNWVKANPDSRLWEIERVEERPKFNHDTGEVEYVDRTVTTWRDPITGEEVPPLSVKIGGETYRITIKDALLARAMQNLGAGETNKVLEGLAAFTRYFSIINTQWNPEFMPTNLARDVQTALVNNFGLSKKMTMKEAASLAKSVAVGVPGAIRGAGVVEFGGKTTGKWEKAYHEFKDAGGTVGHFGLDSAERIRKSIENDLKTLQATPQGTARRLAKHAFELIGNLNTAVENGTRLATYQALRDRGIDAEKAAAVAKSITVDFNQTGEWGHALNALYAFTNASIQGTARMVTALKNPRVAALMGSVGFASYGIAALMRSFGGADPDDEKPYYDKIPAWIRNNNLVIMTGNKGQYIKIPLPYGYNVFWALGQEMDRALTGKDPGGAAAGFVGTVAQAFNPIGTAPTWTQMATPTALRFITDLGVNKNFFGAPIMKEERLMKKTPQAHLSMKRTAEWAKRLAEFGNYATGGNQFESGAIESIPGIGKYVASPDAIDYVFDYFTGGVGKFTNNVLNTGLAAAGKREFTMTTTPFVRRFYGEIQRANMPAHFTKT